ncbi:hypothetical protein [Aquisphaera insulae]|uniref:hypothetical protein n=1 Tax=Aquisphaera insulae TaxID=2712864 RepID=UPI0013ED046E|nr:hypothetical protein [Aquisphaera insulae]
MTSQGWRGRILRRRRPGWALLALSGLLAGGAPPGEEPPPREFPLPRAARDAAVRAATQDPPANVRDEAAPRPPLSTPEIELIDSEVRTAQPAVPGARLALEAGKNAPEGTRFRWIQTEGPPVSIGDSTRPSIQVTIPAGADRLAFLLIAANDQEVRAARVIVPIKGSPTNSWGSGPSAAVKADAGDDQIGLVGHRVTLNGSRSTPSRGRAVRWLQVAGPPVVSPQADGDFFSFVATTPDVYKFLLIVAAGGELSEPDEVAVVVGSPPGPPPAAAMPAPPTLNQVLSSALPDLPRGDTLSSPIADIMEVIAERANLYESYAAIQSELSRRLDVIMPRDPQIRTAWNEKVFAPVTQAMTHQLLAAGLDFTQPQSLNQPLTPRHKELVREQFQNLARAFRAGAATR